MNLDAVRSFLSIAETGSFSLAALRLKVMQSTISGRIQSLEDSDVLIDSLASTQDHCRC